jgi:membrane peptidoglycan carboxypeptidase
VTRPVDAYGTQLSRGPRHGAEDGGGRRALEAYLQFGGRAGDEVEDELDLGFGRRMGGPGRGTPPPRRRRLVDYPRAGRRGVTRWIPSWRVFAALFLLGMAGVTGLVLFLYTNTQLPSRENSDATFQTTIVYYGNTPTHELGRFTAQNRIWKPLDQIPKTVQHAVLSAEDRTFYTNQGVSFTSVVRAALNNVRGGPLQGGSTITQQYVKNAYSSTTDRSFRRKLNEFFVSLKAARELSKDQILERYLNIIYFGRGCYGVEAAAECYFHTSVDKLTPSQAAYLAGVINGPELYDSGTAAATSAARARWDYVLDGMMTQGWLSQRARAKAAFPGKQVARTRTEQPGTSTNRGQQPYLLDMIRAEANQYGISDSELERNGYKIYTTFKPGFVADASRAITSVLGPRKKWPSGTQVALATVDARTGAVVSIYGGDGKRSQNAVRQDIAEAGSTFKPFGLVAALEGKREHGDCAAKAPDEDSLSLRSRFDGHSPQHIPGFTKGPVTNFGKEQFGWIDLVTATAQSVNTVFAKLNDKADPQHTMDVAICAGYPKNTQGLNANPSNVLGPSSPHPIDVARAFATFAAQGVRHDTYVITKIVAPNGAVVAQHDPDSGQQVFDKGVMADATYAMQAVVKQGTGSYVSNLGRPAAGKTGTSSDNLSAWFAGFTPQYATVVAMYRVGKDGRQEPLLPWAGAGSEVTGGTLPARLWTRYMRVLLDGVPVADFPEPVYGGQTVNPAPPPAPVSTTTAQPPQRSSPSPSPSPVQPTPTEPVPTITGTPQPTPSPRPFPTPPHRPRPTFPVPTPTF